MSSAHINPEWDKHSRVVGVPGTEETKIRKRDLERNINQEIAIEVGCLSFLLPASAILVVSLTVLATAVLSAVVMPIALVVVAVVAAVLIALSAGISVYCGYNLVKLGRQHGALERESLNGGIQMQEVVKIQV